MQASHTHAHIMRTCEHFTSINLLRALFSLFCKHQHCEHWRGPTCSLHAHNACCMRAIRSLQAFCKLWQAFYRVHIFIREISLVSRGGTHMLRHMGMCHPITFSTKILRHGSQLIWLKKSLEEGAISQKLRKKL